MSSGVSTGKLGSDLLIGELQNVTQDKPKTTPDGHVLTWSGGQALWIPAPPTGGGAIQSIQGSGLAGTVLTIGISDGGSSENVDLAPLVPSPQNLTGSLLGSVITVAIDQGGTPAIVDIAPALPASQNLSGSLLGTVLTTAIDQGGTSAVVDLAPIIPAPQNLSGILLGSLIQITIDQGGSPALVDIAPALPPSQNLSGSLLGTVLTTAIDQGGTSAVVDLAPIIPAPPNPVGFHNLGEGQTDVADTVSTAPVTDNALIYTGGQWDQVSHGSWTPVVERDKTLNGQLNLTFTNTTTPASGQLGFLPAGGGPIGGGIITNLYVNTTQFGQDYQFVFDNATNVNDFIEVHGDDGIAVRRSKFVYRITSKTLAAGVINYGVTQIQGFGNYIVGTSVGVNVIPVGSLQSTPSYVDLNVYGNAIQLAVGANLAVQTVVVPTVAYVQGDFGATANAWEVQYNGTTPKRCRFNLSVGCFADQVDRKFEFAIFKNASQVGGWISNYTLNNTISPENNSSTSLSETCTNGDVINLRYRLNDVNLPAPTQLTVENIALTVEVI